MSRVGKAPVDIPDGVQVTIENNRVTAKGPKGELQVDIRPEIILKKEDASIKVEIPADTKQNRALHGLSRTLVYNVVQGVSEGFEKKLQIEGVGFRAEMKGKKILLNIGYSHPILVVPPEGVTISVEKDTLITVSGIDKELVGQLAAKIRACRKPEPYKGKGIRYIDEVVKRKAGKAAA
ncbi:50S ribosomal protein L6 [candidate division KSB1 bacterium]|nr:50S ribosomal protein L6 [candidate division KSB1 bacterium]